MDQAVFLPVDNLRFQDLFDWSVPLQRCKSEKVTLSPVKSPKKNGVVVSGNGKDNGALAHTNEQDVALFRYKNRVYAVKDECPHAGGPLHLGEIEDLGEGLLCVRCPWHGWKIDLQTGKVTFPLGHNLKFTVSYPVRVTKEGKLYIGFDGLDEKYFKIEDCDF